MLKIILLALIALSVSLDFSFIRKPAVDIDYKKAVSQIPASQLAAWNALSETAGEIFDACGDRGKAHEIIRDRRDGGCDDHMYVNALFELDKARRAMAVAHHKYMAKDYDGCVRSAMAAGATAYSASMDFLIVVSDDGDDD